MEITKASNAMRGLIKTVECDVKDILESGNYYCTEEIARELTAIQNNLDHLKLDGTLLTSNDWQQAFNPRDTGTAISGGSWVMINAAVFDPMDLCVT
jgi:hypothetical protein